MRIGLVGAIQLAEAPLLAALIVLPQIGDWWLELCLATALYAPTAATMYALNRTSREPTTTEERVIEADAVLTMIAFASVLGTRSFWTSGPFFMNDPTVGFTYFAVFMLLLLEEMVIVMLVLTYVRMSNGGGRGKVH